MLWLRRLRVFGSLWVQLFAWGESRQKRVVKVLSLLFALLGIPAAFWESYLSLSLLLSDPPVFKVRLGVFIGGLVVFVWALVTAAIAWERSGVPVLIVGDDLEWDGLRYRLSLHSKDRPYDTSVRLLEIIDATGRSVVPTGRLNLDMDWTHHSGSGDVHIKKNETETVAIATILEEGRPIPLLRFTGATHGEDIHVIDRVYFHLRVAYDSKPIDRWFCFKRNDRMFEVTNEAPPTQQLAIP